MTASTSRKDETMSVIIVAVLVYGLLAALILKEPKYPDLEGSNRPSGVGLTGLG